MTRSFYIEGHPTPKGSMRHVGGGRLIPQNETKLKLWRQRLAAVLAENRDTMIAAHVPVIVQVLFYFARPASHHLKSGKLSAAGRRRPKPTSARGQGDIDKLIRTVLDELTGSVFTDDSQVVTVNATKLWCQAGHTEHCNITVVLF